MFAATFPGSTYAIAATKAGPSSAVPLRTRCHAVRGCSVNVMRHLPLAPACQNKSLGVPKQLDQWDAPCARAHQDHQPRKPRASTERDRQAAASAVRNLGTARPPAAIAPPGDHEIGNNIADGMLRM